MSREMMIGNDERTLPERPFLHVGRHCNIRFNHCNLRDGIIKIEMYKHIDPAIDIAFLMQDMIEAIGYHATAILPGISSHGFAGYGNMKVEIVKGD